MSILEVGFDKQFDDINTAINTANEGDIVIIHSGNYSGPIYLNKYVHLRAHGNEFIENNVYISFSSSDPLGTLNINVPFNEEGPLYIEGLTIENIASWRRCIYIETDNTSNIIINKCSFIPNLNDGYSYGHNNNGAVVNIYNSTIRRGYGNTINSNSNVSIIKCDFNQEYKDWNEHKGPSDYVDVATIGTIDYGPNYGEFLLPIDLHYFNGKIYLENDLTQNIKVILKRRLDNSIVDETYSTSSGTFNLKTYFPNEYHYIEAMSPNNDYNSVIVDWLYPTTSG